MYCYAGRIWGLGMVGVIGVNYRIFKALAKNGISLLNKPLIVIDEPTSALDTGSTDKVLAFFRRQAVIPSRVEAKIAGMYSSMGTVCAAFPSDTRDDDGGYPTV